MKLDSIGDVHLNLTAKGAKICKLISKQVAPPILSNKTSRQSCSFGFHRIIEMRRYPNELELELRMSIKMIKNIFEKVSVGRK